MLVVHKLYSRIASYMMGSQVMNLITDNTVDLLIIELLPLYNIS